MDEPITTLMEVEGLPPKRPLVSEDFISSMQMLLLPVGIAIGVLVLTSHARRGRRVLDSFRAVLRRG